MAKVAPAEAHVALSQVWIGLEHGRVYSEPLKNTVKYLAAAPIQAALEACEANANGLMQLSEHVVLRQSDWDALVAAVKGETDEK